MGTQKPGHDERNPMLLDFDKIRHHEVQTHFQSRDSCHDHDKRGFLHKLLRSLRYCIVLLVALYAASWLLCHKYLPARRVLSNPRLLREFPSVVDRRMNTLFSIETIESICVAPPSDPSKDLRWTPNQQTGHNIASVVFSKEYNFEFDVLTDNLTASSWALLDSAAPRSTSTIQGEITVNRGNVSQASDIEVYVTVHSNYKMGIAAVVFEKQDHALAMEYSFPRVPKDLWTHVQVTLSLRPHQESVLNELNLQTNLLDVHFKPFLMWEVNNLVINSTYGNLTFVNNIFMDPLVAHNTSVSLVHGRIFGCFIPAKNLDISNQYGLTQLNLVPNLSPEAPAFEPESITITSQVEIQAVAGYWLWPSKPYSHRTKIETAGAMLAGAFIHGSYTNLTSDGDMDVVLFSFNTDDPDIQTEIYTNSQRGATWFDLYRTDWDLSGGEYNPLENIYIEHIADIGYLVLRYDEDWAGSFEATVERGKIQMQEEKWDILDRGKGYRKARRGENGSSEILAHVKEWGMSIVILERNWP